ncbi:hypothetical protein A3F66_07035 [candidate division TM6 bacterium RIFCSPHIGHO2_12_FULL_32_22]|nr:MAG: hypothetical protein A3F66_07035 [candidate division TM6 bacterium RIFCSPHIGHO2_12_FULL_32_22]
MKPLTKPIGKNPFPKKEIKEEDKTTSFFCNEYRKIAKLTATGKSLFLGILSLVEPDLDYVYFDKEKYMKDNGLTASNTYRKGLEELIRVNFIRRTEDKEFYWINTNVFNNRK